MRAKVKLFVTGVIIIFQFSLLSINAMAISPDEVNNESVFLKQEAEDFYCTLIASTNMLRRKAILNEDNNWIDITKDAVKKVAWSSQGLYNSFTYENFSVKSGKFKSTSYESKKNELITLLNEHPEGIVIYKLGSAPHAVLITDFSDNLFYCADPSPYWGAGRIQISSASITLDETSKYWYIASDSTPIRQNPNTSTQPEIKTEYRSRTRSVKTEYITSEYPSLDGWENIGSSQNDILTEWSAWQSGCIENSDTREVEERTVAGTSIEIFLGRYYSESKNNFSPTKLDDSYIFEGGWFNADSVTFIGQAYSWGRTDCHSIEGYHYFFFPIGEYGGQTRNKSDDSEKEYRYRDIIGNNEYQYKREIYTDWSMWIEWNQILIKEDELTQVEERTLTQ